MCSGGDLRVQGGRLCVAKVQGRAMRKETEVVGHAVFFTYLYVGAADAYMETEDKELIAALERLWRQTPREDYDDPVLCLEQPVRAEDDRLAADCVVAVFQRARHHRLFDSVGCRLAIAANAGMMPCL